MSRTGDVLREVLQADRQLANINPVRKIPGQPFNVEDCRIGVGTDFEQQRRPTGLLSGNAPVIPKSRVGSSKPCDPSGRRSGDFSQAHLHTTSTPNR